MKSLIFTVIYIFYKGYILQLYSLLFKGII